MTLLFVSYAGVFGGAERVLLDCAAAVDGAHWLACPEGPLAERARGAGLTVVPIRRRRPNLRASARDRVLTPGRLLAHAREVRALVRNLDPDAVIAWGMRSAIASLGRSSNGRPVAFAHNDMLPGPLAAVVVRAVAARAAVVIVPSRAVAVDLDPGTRLGSRLQVVHPGVDLDRFRCTQAPAQPPQVLVLGALAAWKRPELALEACALARVSVPELRLRLVGGPPPADNSTLKRLRVRASRPDLAGAVELAGDHAETKLDLAHATCLLHCAPNEPFGLVVAEALAAGRPVIVPDAAGPAEIVDSSCALLYPPGDHEAAGRAIVELVADRERAARMGVAGRRRAESYFGRAQATAGFARTLKPLARPRAGRVPGSEQLALVIVSHNSEHELAALLESIRRHLPMAQVVVVDCASRDASAEVARDRSMVTTIELDENIGFGRACNIGVKAVLAPVTMLVNPDVELIDASPMMLAEQALRTDVAERLLAPLVLSPDGTRQDTVHPVPTSAADLVGTVISSALARPEAGLALAPWKASVPRRVGWAVGCALAARTETLGRLGPFDESIFLYSEDLDLCLRAAEQDIETWFWPATRVLHHRAHSSSKAFGGEPFEVVAQARHDVVARRLGAGRARLDDVSQALTFASRALVKRALGRSATRERKQLEAVLRRRGG